MASILDRIRGKTNGEIPAVKVKNFFTALQRMVRNVNHPSVLNQVDPRQLYRFTWSLDDWNAAVDNAEDVHNQNLFDLAEIYHDIVDDYSVSSAMQQRTAKAINSKIMFIGPDGTENEAIKPFFLNVDGSQKPWFRRWLKIAMDSKYYGFSVAELGSFIDGQFRRVEGRAPCESIPYENLLPMYRYIKKDAEAGIHEDNLISMDRGAFARWLTPIGAANDLGLLNKATPYVIWKNVFANWSQHAEIFGQPFREGRTDIYDPERKEQMRKMFEEMVGSTYGIFHPDDEVSFIETSKTDAFKIYDGLIERCDQAITKIFLSQTGTTDEKAFVGSTQAHERVMSDVVMNDRFDLSEYFEDILLPRLKAIGAVGLEESFSLVWIVEEHLTLIQWSEIITALSQNYTIPVEEINKRFDIEVEEKLFPEQAPGALVKEIEQKKPE